MCRKAQASHQERVTTPSYVRQQRSFCTFVCLLVGCCCCCCCCTFLHTMRTKLAVEKLDKTLVKLLLVLAFVAGLLLLLISGTVAVAAFASLFLIPKRRQLMATHLTIVLRAVSALIQLKYMQHCKRAAQYQRPSAVFVCSFVLCFPSSVQSFGYNLVP